MQDWQVEPDEKRQVAQGEMHGSQELPVVLAKVPEGQDESVTHVEL